jgi:hypothetical protein
MRRPSAFLVAVVGLVVVAAAGRARAQNGVDSELFRPALDSYGIFTVDRAQTSHQWDWGFKLYVDYAANPLRLAICPPTGSCVAGKSMTPPLTSVMAWQTVAHFGFHLGLTNWLEFVADLPVSAESYTAAYGDNGSFGSMNLQRTGFYAAQGFTHVPPPQS